MIKKFSDRFEQLYSELATVEKTIRRVNIDSDAMDQDLALTWKVKVKNLLVSACGEDSQHFKEFLKAETGDFFLSSIDIFKSMKAVFIAAMDDYKGGYLTSFKNLIQAEIFDSELEQAQELLSNSYIVAAAVIAGVVLETTLRDMCTREGLAHGKLDKMNADLKKKGVYNKLQQKRITALADIRNSAAHGKSKDFTKNDVVNMIQDIEQFLANSLV